MFKGKEITIYDIADKLNISIATVSRALKDDPVVNKKTKKKVFDLAEKMGYRSNHFARNLRNQRTHTIGVIANRLNSYFMSTVIAGIEKTVNDEGYNLIIIQSAEILNKEIAASKTMFNSRVDGLLVTLSYETESLHHFDPFLKRKIPVFFFDRCEEHELITRVLIDNKKAGYEATNHLIGQGCKRILHITAPQKRSLYKQRMDGFRKALRENNLQFNEDLVLINNLSIEAGTESAEYIMNMKHRPDGVFVANDNCAVGCMIALKQKGVRIPEDIAFVGFNNDPVSKVVEPNLTTINYPGYEMGEVAARNLIGHLKGTYTMNTTNTIVLRSELIIRASSQKIPPIVKPI
ncbi:MAG: LacI family DNA-binding transcriptional regulator [Bacteroidia bacterium]|nr:LacI family DNA-binding transcriptional regulator [Bacteroidia bacterium]